MAVNPNFNKILSEALENNKPTKADEMRRMSDEELAEFQANIGYCPPIHNRGYHCKRHEHESCSACWLDWLRSPAGGDKDE